MIDCSCIHPPGAHDGMGCTDPYCGCLSPTGHHKPEDQLSDGRPRCLYRMAGTGAQCAQPAGHYYGRNRVPHAHAEELEAGLKVRA